MKSRSLDQIQELGFSFKNRFKTRHSHILHSHLNFGFRMGRIWATAEDLGRNRVRVLSLYRQILRSLNSPELPLSFAARLAKKAEARAMFWVGSDERSLHNIADLIDAAEYSLSFLRKSQLPPRYIT